MVGSRRTDNPLLRVNATRFLASAALASVAGEAARKVDILAERNSDAVPPTPMARTVLDTVQ